MKLLGWMHRKFRQNNSEPFKDFAIGQPPPNEQLYCPKPSYGIKSSKQTPRDHSRNSFAGLEAARREEETYEEEPSAEMSELFHGFLAIGTLGSDPNINCPSTPTFAISLENITGQEAEVTESELRLLNDKLEKVLGAEAREDNCYDSSGRNSHVSTGRSSQGSTITLSGKALEVPDTNRNGGTVCPLQGYLFGSAIELSETTTAAKKEQRTSLRELFQRTKIAEENTEGRCEREEKRVEKETEKSAVNVMKKMLKKKLLHASRTSTSALPSYGTAESASAETKLHKILQMFQRKVHPERSASRGTNGKLMKNDQKKQQSTPCDGTHNNEGRVPRSEAPTFPSRSLQKGVRHYRSHPNERLTLSAELNENKEFWIKTDTDYLVLEL